MGRIGAFAPLRRIITILSSIAVILSFFLAGAGALQITGSDAAKAGGLSEKAYYFFTGSSGDPALVTQDDDSSGLFLRMDFQKLPASWGVPNSGYILYASRFRAALKYGFVNITDSIILKLRT